ncbi:SDR family NAD(P)-dependent oxidoreductase [Nocardia xishanensis]|uniref:SDR family NAD(P)-dependent oxidoreductase n=1 Tax=Nocardia xishanensis TaxID=238964 RepID=UPI00083319FD|nr:SDR family NAD(P)-dependent oxidoreductase [Nocardia xishanensis]
MSRYSLRDKVVLITGATGGIGAACARDLLDRGARLVLVDLDRAALDALSAELGTGAVLAVAADVTSFEQMRSVADQAVARFGRIDVVFANAGTAVDPPVTVATADVAAYERVIEVNLLGVWRTVKACLDEVIRNDGYVLVTASIYAFVNGIANSAYATSKAAVEMFGRSLRTELAHTGARAGVLLPGWVVTPLAHPALGGNQTATTMARRAFKGPLGQPISPERVAHAVTAGIERRSARIIEPRRWAPISLLRGIFATATDAWLDHDRTMSALVQRLESEAKH